MTSQKNHWKTLSLFNHLCRLSILSPRTKNERPLQRSERRLLLLKRNNPLRRVAKGNQQELSLRLRKKRLRWMLVASPRVSIQVCLTTTRSMLTCLVLSMCHSDATMEASTYTQMVKWVVANAATTIVRKTTVLRRISSSMSRVSKPKNLLMRRMRWPITPERNKQYSTLSLFKSLQMKAWSPTVNKTLTRSWTMRVTKLSLSNSRAIPSLQRWARKSVLNLIGKNLISQAAMISKG